MIRRASVEDAEQINDWIWRDSGSRPDFTPFLAERLHVFLVCGEGGAMFLYRGPGVFEAHCFFEQRGKEALAITHEMLRMMAEDYGATRMIWAAVPEKARKVKLFVRWLGFKSAGHETLANGPCELFILENK